MRTSARVRCATPGVAALARVTPSVPWRISEVAKKNARRPARRLAGERLEELAAGFRQSTRHARPEPGKMCHFASRHVASHPKVVWPTPGHQFVHAASRAALPCSSHPNSANNHHLLTPSLQKLLRQPHRTAMHAFRVQSHPAIART